MGNLFFDFFASGGPPEASGGASGGPRALRRAMRDPDLRMRVEEGPNQWAEQMMRAGSDDVRTWADFIALAAAARVTRCVVLVLIDNHQPMLLSPVGAGAVVDAHCLRRTGGQHGHYVPLVMPEPMRQHLAGLPPKPMAADVTGCDGDSPMQMVRQGGSAGQVEECEKCRRPFDRSARHHACGRCWRKVCASCAVRGERCPGYIDRVAVDVDAPDNVTNSTCLQNWGKC